MLCTVLVYITALASFESANALTVYTSNGPITGHAAPNVSDVIEYLGIPYAKPPIGNLRFAPPQPLTSTSPYDAIKFGHDYPLTASKLVNYPGFTPQAQRIVNYFASAAGTPQSEDCLTLNIWAKPTPKCPKSQQPVLVFFYGGRFTIGNTNTPFYNGKHLASAQDLVVVTVNYRLNIFGFPGAPGQPQNLGLRDQRDAVEWVRDNIAAFGGDTSKITIMGQSSGGVGVDYWAYAYAKDPIAHALIAHSGTALSFPMNSKAVQQGNWNAVVAAVNCSSPNNTSATTNITNPSTMACMRAILWQTLLSAATTLRPAKSNSPLRSIPAFWPTPDNTLVFAPSTYLTTPPSPLPILLGTAHNENSYY